MHNYDKWLESGAHDNEDEDVFVEDRVAELMRGEYNPFTPANILTAISEECLFKDSDLESMSDYMEQRKITELGLLVKCRIVEYWENQANNHAHEDWQNGYRD
jgi:hypothetical protein